MYFDLSSEDGRHVVGERPPSLGEPRGSVGVVHPACPCTTVPLLALAELGCGREGVDSSAIVFLVSRAVQDRKEEVEKSKEEEARVERIENLILVLCRRQGGPALMGFGGQEEEKEEEEEEASEGFFLSISQAVPRPHHGGLVFDGGTFLGAWVW